MNTMATTRSTSDAEKSNIVCCQRAKCPRKSRILSKDGKVVAEHAILEPCGHIYCARCLAYKLARRETSMVCSGCQKTVSAHRYVDQDEENNCQHVMLDPDPYLDPFLYFVQDFQKNGPEAYARLSLSYVCDGEPMVLTSAFELQRGPETLHDRVVFLRILAALNPAILHDTQVDLKMQHLMPHDLCNYAIEKDKRFLTKCIFALAVGEDCVNKAELAVNPIYQGRFLASFCASEMIAHISSNNKRNDSSNSTGAQHLQMMIANQLWTSNASPETWRIFSLMRLSVNQKLFEASSVSKKLDSFFEKVDDTCAVALSDEEDDFSFVTY